MPPNWNLMNPHDEGERRQDVKLKTIALGVMLKNIPSLDKIIFQNLCQCSLLIVFVSCPQEMYEVTQMYRSFIQSASRQPTCHWFPPNAS